jgi:hypothetical protein
MRIANIDIWEIRYIISVLVHQICELETEIVDRSGDTNPSTSSTPRQRSDIASFQLVWTISRRHSVVFVSMGKCRKLNVACCYAEMNAYVSFIGYVTWTDLDHHWNKVYEQRV